MREKTKKSKKGADRALNFLDLSEYQTRQKGAATILVLVFTSIFLVIAGGLVSYSLLQHKLAEKKIAQELALHIAEAGVNYYRWHLASDPDDFTDNTGLLGPYVHDFTDPLGAVVGKFSLDITPPAEFSSTVTIKSTGWTLAEPNTKRVVQVQYGRSSFADFAFLTNSNVWFGDSEELHGPVHSNGGIRMDGAHDSTLASAKETYICGFEHGCNPGGETKPGIWGTGGTPALWQFPKPIIDFNVITVELASFKTQAQDSGFYLPPSGLGYHTIFQADGSFDVYQINELRTPVIAWNGTQVVSESNDIQTETFVQNVPAPGGPFIIFVEDNLWVEGTVKGRFTLVSASLPDIPNTNTKVVLNGNLVYAAKDGTNTLGIIAQKDVLVPLYAAPDNLEINAVLMAQKGHVMRHYYSSAYAPFYLRNSLTLYGAIITNTIWTWSWVNGLGVTISGYQNTSTTYDSTLTFNPPPNFPLSGEYQILKWEELTGQ